MIGIVMAGLGAFFAEISASIGKWEVKHKKETLFLMGFLAQFWAVLAFTAFGLFQSSFSFTSASLPTLLIRLVLEIVQSHIGLLALLHSNRSTVGFITLGTIPLLLIVDLTLGYALSTTEIIGILIIISSLLYIFLNHGFEKRGMWYVIIMTVNAALTISLYKYNITHFNSVATEAVAAHGVLLLYFMLFTFYRNKINPFPYLLRYPFGIQSIAQGGAALFIGMSYAFAPASVITTAKRSFAVLASIISGKVYFRERKIALKITAFGAVLIGLILLGQ